MWLTMNRNSEMNGIFFSHEKESFNSKNQNHFTLQYAADAYVFPLKTGGHIFRTNIPIKPVSE
jgi:hypothetical protein